MIEKSLLQVYTDLHPRLSPKCTIRGNILNLSVEGGPHGGWRDTGQHAHRRTHTYRRTRAHAHTPSRTHCTHTLSHTLTHPGAPRGSGPVRRLRVEAGPAAPTAMCCLAVGAQSQAMAPLKEPQAAGRALFLLLICVWREPIQPGLLQKPRSVKDGHFNDFQTCGLCLGNRDSPGAAEICPGRGGVLQEAGRPQRWGGSFSPGCYPHLGSERPVTPTLSREHAPHGRTLKS